MTIKKHKISTQGSEPSSDYYYSQILPSDMLGNLKFDVPDPAVDVQNRIVYVEEPVR